MINPWFQHFLQHNKLMYEKLLVSFLKKLGIDFKLGISILSDFLIFKLHPIFKCLDHHKTIKGATKL